MKITIVTVCFNAATHIEGCLRSVAEQTHQPIEHIVIDGASTDSTGEVVRRYPHVTAFVSERDKGIYDAMNKGLALATGEYVLFLNADDKFPQPETLAEAVQQIKCNPGADVYYGWLEVRPIDGDAVIFRPPPPEDAPCLMICGCLPHQSTLARPAVFEKTGLFDLKFRYHADYDWFLKVLSDPTIDVRSVPCVIGSFRAGGVSSDLAKGQPEAYAIQNSSPLYAGTVWDKRRLAEFQKMLLNERIENARLSKELSALRMTKKCKMRAPLKTGPALLRASLLRFLSPRTVEMLRSLRARKW